MTSQEAPTHDDIDPAIPLESDESVVWTAHPRVTRVLPAVVTGLALVLAGVVGWVVAETALALLLVPLGVAGAGWRYLANRNTQYVVSEDALYKKTGVLSRAVTQAALETVQNSAYAQSLTGSLFGYGSVEFELAGGGSLVFRGVPDPREVRALVDQTTKSDGIAGDATDDGVPGDVEQWRAIREEVVALRETVKRRG
ncbi:PH domain-containing protein [Halarchaeum sp. P4]|uniref:PH domain-containing protein n=1 Tax=Halarchaeum sp. P4 TaxID=3421639 RepID=UPI003EBDBEA6